ncbi:hypothetical protein PV762_06735 [Mitsuaria sp. CC2]|uniref:hypothetical protein n=1 Tax=Mitsuaria sp. CC2 TaxID=3029186 RepID=UPI003B8DFC40
MMLWNVYLREGLVLMPTMAKTDAGFFIEVEPVSVVRSDKLEDIARALKANIQRGNPLIETPSRDNFPKPVVLPYAKVKTWSTFEKKVQCWKILWDGSEYQLKPQRRASTRGLEDVPGELSSFGGVAGLDQLVNSLIERIDKFAEQ